MSIIRTRLHPNNDASTVLYPETEIEQVELGDNFTVSKSTERNPLLSNDLLEVFTITLKDKSVDIPIKVFPTEEYIPYYEGANLNGNYYIYIRAAIINRFPLYAPVASRQLYLDKIVSNEYYYKSMDGTAGFRISILDWIMHLDV